MMLNLKLKPLAVVNNDAEVDGEAPCQNAGKSIVDGEYVANANDQRNPSFP
jgi:hypothetical protein